jgi:hypothetical protein
LLETKNHYPKLSEFRKTLRSELRSRRWSEARKPIPEATRGQKKPPTPTAAIMSLIRGQKTVYATRMKRMLTLVRISSPDWGGEEVGICVSLCSGSETQVLAINQSIHTSINQSIQSINPINQSTHPSINQSNIDFF